MSRVTRKPVLWVLDQVDTNWAVQPQKMAKGLKFRSDSRIYVAKTKALISCGYHAKSWFSHDAVHIITRFGYTGMDPVAYNLCIFSKISTCKM